VGEPSRAIGTPQFFFTTGGRAVATWQQGYRRSDGAYRGHVLATAPPGGGFTTHPLGKLRGRPLHLVPCGDRKLLVIQATIRGVEVTESSFTGRLDDPTRLATSGGPDSVVASNPRGDAVVAWVRNPDRPSSTLVARFARRCGRFSPPVSLASGAVDEPQIDLNEKGDTLLAWRTRVQNQSDVSAVIRRANGSRLGPEPLGHTGDEDAIEVTSASLGPTGMAVVAFTPYNIDDRKHWEFPTGVFAALRRPGHRFDPPQLLADLGDPSTSTGTRDAQAMVTPKGDAVVAWTEEARGEDNVVRVAVARAGPFQNARQVSRGHGAAELADLALWPGGEVTALWRTGSIETGDFVPRVMFAATRLEGGRHFGPAERVVKERPPLEVQDANLAYDPVRRAPVAVWSVERCPRNASCGVGAIHTARRR